MSPDQELKTSITHLRRRIRILLAERYGFIGASAGMICAALLAVLSLRYDALISYPLWIGTVIIGVLAGITWALIRPLTDLSVAISADKRANMKERLSTAISINNPGNIHSQAVITDAISHSSSLRPRDVFPHRFGYPHGTFGIALIILLAAILVPQMPSLQSQTRRQEIQVMKREGAKLEKIAKDIRRQTSPKHEELRKLANKIDALGKKMKSGRMTRKQAMLKTRKLTKDVKEQQDLLAKKNSAIKPMFSAQTQVQKSTEELTRQMAAEIAKKNNVPLAEAMKQVPSDKRLAELARKEGTLSQAERKELEKAISKYANPKDGSPVPSELSEALAKLAENGDYQKASELMKKLAQKLNSGSMSKQDQKSLQKQMDALAKALKNTDLDKLAKAMRQNAEKLANMSDADLKKLMKQIEDIRKQQRMLAKAGHG